MPPRSNAASSVVSAVDGLLEAVTGLVGAVRQTLDSGRQVGAAAREVQVTASDKGKKLQKSLKSYWANLKGKARQERIRKMLAGRGLVPKAKGAKAKAAKTKPANGRRRKAAAV